MIDVCSLRYYLLPNTFFFNSFENPLPLFFMQMRLWANQTIRSIQCYIKEKHYKQQEIAKKLCTHISQKSMWLDYSVIDIK